ncbi:hypothetical protein HY251_15130 [bacterium]|nr:hypothetical protein [bacterium]
MKAFTAQFPRAVIKGQALETEKVRSDFYYRIGLAVIELAPLRERMGDLDLLVPHFLERCRGPGPPAALTEDAWAKLRGHDWRGNVRELEGVISTAYVLAGKKGPITAHHIELPSLAGPEPARHDPLDPGVVAKVVDDLKGNQSEAARILGVDRKTIARKLGKT